MTALGFVALAACYVATSVAVLRIACDWNRGDPVAAVDAGLLALVATYIAMVNRWHALAVVMALYAGFQLGCHSMAQRYRTATTAARVYDHEDEET